MQKNILNKEIIHRLYRIMRCEVATFSHRPVFLFCMLIAPILCISFFTTLMQAGLPKKLPAAIVDEDNSHITRIIARIIDSFEQTDIKYKFSSFHEARKAVQEGKIYAVYMIPKGTTRKTLSGKQPTISFYTNDVYYVPANLLMKDMKTSSELASLALTRETLYAHGLNEKQAM